MGNVIFMFDIFSTKIFKFCFIHPKLDSVNFRRRQPFCPAKRGVFSSSPRKRNASVWKRCWNELSPKVRGAVGEPVILGEWMSSSALWTHCFIFFSWMSLHIEDCVLYGFTMRYIIYICTCLYEPQSKHAMKKRRFGKHFCWKTQETVSSDGTLPKATPPCTWCTLTCFGS